MGDVVMPRLSDSMQDGTIARWLKHEGEVIRSGDELAEIETDKASVIYEAPDGGVLEIVAPVAATVPVGEVIARLHPG